MSQTLAQPAETEGGRIRARIGSHLSDADAKTVWDHVTKKLKEDERTAQNVVELARPANSPIHKFFEWDDERAAAEYRRVQARYIMRSVCVERTDEAGEVQLSPVFYAVRMNPEVRARSYVVLRTTVKPDEALRQDVLERVRLDVLAFQHRYAEHRAILDDDFPELAALLDVDLDY